MEQWQELIGRPIPEEPYQQAIQYYTKLKDKMFNQIIARTKQAKVKDKYQSFNDDIENQIVTQTTNWNESFQYATQTLNRIPVAVQQVIENNSTQEFKNLILELRAKSQKIDGDIAQQQAAFKTAFKQAQNKLLTALGVDKKFLINLLGPATNLTGDYNDLIAQVSSYFTRYIYGTIFNDGILGNEGNPIFQLSIQGAYNKYLMSMGGFYKELAENDLLTKLFQGVTNVYHGGPKKTELDIIISDLTNLDMIFDKNEQIILDIQGFNDADINELVDNLIARIDWFGEQVKSSKLGTIQTFKIGSRKDLFNAFLDEGGSKYSSLQSLHYFARLKNILLALGAANVLISTNGKRQWMSDFITEFRQQNYYLSFYRPNVDKELTSLVTLEQFYTQQRKNIRKKFTT